MKKVIGGSLYNTETAQEQGVYTLDGTSRRDFNFYTETLYKTKAGKYFIYGEGNGNSPYAHHVGNSRTWGEKILPLSLEDAQEWAERNLDGDEYSEIFGEPEEAAENKVPLNITISAELKNSLDRQRSETGKSISQIISEAFEGQ